MEGENVAANERSRLHEIVEALPDDELSVARQLLELLAKGRAASAAARDGVMVAGSALDGADEDADGGGPVASADTIAKLAQLTDDELLRLDDLLETDPATAKQFWRERFGEELEDDGLAGV